MLYVRFGSKVRPRTFSVRLFCSVTEKILCRYGCMYFLAAVVLVCVDVMVMSSV